MAYKDDLAAEWRRQIEQLDKSIAAWEAGPLKAWHNGVDVTSEQAPMLRRHQQALRDALEILEMEKE
ncbi:hypothetical protein [Sphingomonas sp. Leaf37]|uniref:hypothetical protein n=1 Tax=Sphingomonas sp. Leaf37 TaxID=2876552 RepID=UPI001E38AAD2|nr:hypothetical protein [Sphingomonas sp. Leaf37]